MGIEIPRKIRNSVLAVIIASSVVIAIISSFFDFSALGQTEVFFTPATKFLIPANNSSISFAFNGTYGKAELENGFLKFENLQISNNQRAGTINLKVSAKDSIVRIMTCQIYNSSFAGSRVINALLRYAVVGNGKQVFNVGLDPEGGNWEVIQNGNWIGKNHGWSLSNDGAVTVIGAAGNVSLVYYGFPISFEESENGSIQSFLKQHSVAITTTVVVAVIVIFATAISVKNKKHVNNVIVKTA